MDPVETGRRVRAARGYAGLEAKDAQKALNLSSTTLWRIEKGQRDIEQRLLEQLADLCGTPRHATPVAPVNDESPHGWRAL